MKVTLPERIREFDDSEIARTARACLPERQLEVWTRTHRPPCWTQMRIAVWLRVSPATVGRDLASARMRLREELETSGVLTRFEMTIAHSHDAKTVVNSTAEETVRRIERGEWRRQRIAVSSIAALTEK